MGAAVSEAANVLGNLGATASGMRIGVYANAFVPMDPLVEANAGLTDLRVDVTPQAYLGWARDWVARGAQIVCLPELYRSPYFCQKEDQALFDLYEAGQITPEQALVQHHLARDLQRYAARHCRTHEPHPCHVSRARKGTNRFDHRQLHQLWRFRV
jgi:hypothetical protein